MKQENYDCSSNQQTVRTEQPSGQGNDEVEKPNSQKEAESGFADERDCGMYNVMM